ncbi:MAG TPA: hypothetical protein VMB52_05505 [Verrucomicrobiae bacterium]|nr:hypothetical protein [Verrucomicrobiae bacterium]
MSQEQHVFVNRQLDKLLPEDTEPYETFSVEPTYTLIAQLPENIRSQLHTLTIALSDTFSKHYYYAPVQYHTTLLSLGTSEDVATKLDCIRKAIRGVSIHVEVLGTAANKYGAGVTLYPPDDTVVKLRQKLREAFAITAGYTEHNVVWEQLLWVNILRFSSKPTNRFLEKLREYKDTQLGSYEIRSWDLYKTSSKVLAPESSTWIETFRC